jgi:L-serine dehydratase
MLFKRGATISGSEGGCMAEVGVSTAMAAAGFTAICGGTPSQIFQAAEIDPIGGLVQAPCIERNLGLFPLSTVFCC